MTHKKGDITLTTIIIAILVILVLVVLVIVFSKGIGSFSLGAGSCSTRGGDCISKSECDSRADCQESGCAKISLKECDKLGADYVCCVPVNKPSTSS